MDIHNHVEIKFLIECQEHIPQLAVLWYEGISRIWVPTASVDRAQENLMKHINKDQLPLTFVALHEGKPVGMASLRNNDGIRSDLTPWLGSLVVHPDFQNLGIGKKLIEHVKNHAKKNKYGKLYLLAFDETIPGWYAALGWERLEDDQLFGHPVAVMSINLC